MRRYLWLFVAMAACAKGGQAGDDTGDDTTIHPDAPGQPIDSSQPPIDGPPIAIDGPPGTIDAPPAIDAMPIDAMPIDAPPQPQPRTLSQSNSMTITSPNTVACGATDGSGNPYTDDNQFYRAFSLTASGITGQFTAQRINLGIEEANVTAGSQPITITLSTVAGAFPGGTLTTIGSQVFTINNATGVTLPLTLTTPAIAPAGSTVVVEIASAGFASGTNTFYPGSNALGETGSSYISSAGCGVTTPTTFTAAGFPGVDLVLTVDGTTP
jgi:hypothetical protein